MNENMEEKLRQIQDLILENRQNDKDIRGRINEQERD